ncbi:E3 ubiquitin-protein ligase HACE1-like [Clytia hemisphaerica]|uniref:E3 ubiquitin-protein ligase HACE1 n=1 Tax=Clytia hemisphaerica TaxID=252671 RepID=A0A7M5X410_9CNID
MESLQRLVRSLKSGRSVELPADTQAAYFMLLSYVMQKEHKTFIELLATSTTFDVNFSAGKYGRTLLHMAANVGAFECLCHLLKKGAAPDVFDRQGITPLQVAARNGYIRCICKLLEYGANIQMKNNEGMTAIHWLASNGRTDVFPEIKKYLDNIDIEDENKQSPLHVASLNGHQATVLKLIEMKADIEKRDVNGCTPLFFACRHGQSNVVKELLQHGATLQNSHDNVTPLFAAFESGYGKVCWELISWCPELLSNLLQYCLDDKVDIEKIEDVLTCLVSQDKEYRSLVLLQISKYVHAEGMKLLSQIPEVDKVTSNFIKYIKIFIKLVTFNEPVERSRSETRQRMNSVSVFRTFTPGTNNPVQLANVNETRPENLDDIEMEFNTLWATMESWMSILYGEMRGRSDSPEPSSSDETSPRSQDSITETSSLRSFATRLRTSNPKLYRSVSRTSTNIEQRLRLSQPAYTLNSYDEDSTVYLNRSPSYSSALSDIDDDFEKRLATTPSDTSLDQDSTSDQNILNMTADRLCATINGYHLYCSVVFAWDQQNSERKIQFAKFLHRYEEVLLLMVSRKSQLIFEHFSFLLENPVLLQRFLPAIHCQPLADRQKWFYERVYADKERNSAIFDEESVIHVTRDSLLQTSCKELSGKNDDVLKKNVSIRFAGEQGMGAGVTREWLDLLVKELLNPDFALFTLSADGSTFQPNSSSSVNPDHLNYFLFAGKIMGLALYHKQLITAYFTRSFYKHILGIPVNYKDVESIDPVFSQSLQTILDNDIDDLGMEIPFSMESSVFGEIQEVELIPDGKSLLVNDNNKHEYVNLVADLKMTRAIKPQILAFLEGFYTYIPHSLVSLFNEYELELLLSGIPDVDVEDWKKHTTYQAGFDHDDQTIKWFWEVVEDVFTKEEQVELLQFVTGTSRVPWGGFANLAGATGSQQFTICRTEGKQDLLPTASTCFNMLKLPDYETKEILEKKIRIAITCGGQGFEFT